MYIYLCEQVSLFVDDDGCPISWKCLLQTCLDVLLGKPSIPTIYRDIWAAFLEMELTNMDANGWEVLENDIGRDQRIWLEPYTYDHATLSLLKEDRKFLNPGESFVHLFHRLAKNITSCKPSMFKKVLRYLVQRVIILAPETIANVGVRNDHIVNGIRIRTDVPSADSVVNTLAEILDAVSVGTSVSIDLSAIEADRIVAFLETIDSSIKLVRGGEEEREQVSVTAYLPVQHLGVLEFFAFDRFRKRNIRIAIVINERFIEALRTDEPYWKFSAGFDPNNIGWYTDKIILQDLWRTMHLHQTTDDDQSVILSRESELIPTYGGNMQYVSPRRHAVRVELAINALKAFGDRSLNPTDVINTAVFMGNAITDLFISSSASAAKINGALEARNLSIDVCGLVDLFESWGINIDSIQGQALTYILYRFVYTTGWLHSIRLAEDGSFDVPTHWHVSDMARGVLEKDKNDMDHLKSVLVPTSDDIADNNNVLSQLLDDLDVYIDRERFTDIMGDSALNIYFAMTIGRDKLIQLRQVLASHDSRACNTLLFGPVDMTFASIVAGTSEESSTYHERQGEMMQIGNIACLRIEPLYRNAILRGQLMDKTTMWFAPTCDDKSSSRQWTDVNSQIEVLRCNVQDAKRELRDKLINTAIRSLFIDHFEYDGGPLAKMNANDFIFAFDIGLKSLR